MAEAKDITLEEAIAEMEAAEFGDKEPSEAAIAKIQEVQQQTRERHEAEREEAKRQPPPFSTEVDKPTQLPSGQIIYPEESIREGAKTFVPTKETPKPPWSEIYPEVVSEAEKGRVPKGALPVTVSGEQAYIPKSDLMDLEKESPELHKVLTTQGYDTYKQTIDAINLGKKAQQEMLERDYIKGKGDEWIKKQDYESLPFELKRTFISQGFEPVKQYYDQQQTKYDNAITTLKKGGYLDNEGNVNISQFLIENPLKKQTLLDVGIKAQDIADFRVAQAKQMLPKNVRQLFNELKEQIPENIIQQAPKLLLYAITPWQETKGEKPIDYYRKFITPREEEPQEKLKAEYEANQLRIKQIMTEKNPWLKIVGVLSSNYTVAKDPKTNRYYRVIIGEAPPIAGKAKTAAKTVTKVLGREDIGMSASQYDKFLQARKIDSKLTPEAFKIKEAFERVMPAINKGIQANIKKATNRLLGKTEEVTRTLSPKQLDAKATSWAKRNLKVRNESIAAELYGVGEKQVARYLSKLPANKAKEVKKILTKIDNTPIRAIAKQALKPVPVARLKVVASPSVSVKPAELVKSWQQLKPEVFTQYVTKTLNEVDNAKKLGLINLTQAQTLTKSLTDLQRQNLERLAYKTALELSTKNLTQSQIQSQLEQKLQEQISEKLSTKLQNELRTMIKPVTKTATEGVSRSKVKVTTITGVEKVNPVDEITGKKTKVPKIPKITLVLPKTKSEKKKKKSKKAEQYVITWWQSSKSGWYVLYPPYKKENTKLMKRPPKGAIMVDSKASAYKTIQSIGGNSMVKLDLDLGNQDILIRKPTKKAGKKGAIRFRKDANRKTKGDFSLAGVRMK